jgi:exodeoxyribonuclease V beta subunit
MRAALATRTLHLGFAELERLNTDELHWEVRGKELMELRETWRHAGVLAMLHRLLHVFDLPARLLAMEHGERALTNVLHLAELLQQAAATLEGEQALIRYLAERIADTASHHGDDQIVRLESDDDLVKVITIHKSKGLEYPLVFLPFVCASGKARSGQGYRYHDGEGISLELLSEKQGGPAVSEAKEAAERAALQEDLRLLYVALTRARHACWLGVAPVAAGNAKKPQVHRSAFGHLLTGGVEIDNGAIAGLLTSLAQGHPSIAVDYMPAPDDRRYLPPARDDTPLPPREPRLARAEPWRIASYSGLRYDAAAPELPVPETASDDVIAEYVSEPVATAADPDSIHGFHRGADAGTFLHDLLEWIADEGFAVVAGDPVRLRDTVARRCERRGWQGAIDLLTDWLLLLLRTPMPLPDGGSVALGELDDPSRYRAELEFLFETRHVDTVALDRIVREHTLGGVSRVALTSDTLNGMLKGFIDLIIEHEGRWYIIDYKSNWLGADQHAYTAEAMRASILDSRYELQYSLYLLALHRLLRIRLGAAYDYDTHVGGAAYLYLRGMDGRGHGVHVERPPKAMIDAMDRLFEGASA